MAATSYRKLLLGVVVLLLLALSAYGVWLPPLMYRDYQALLAPFIKELRDSIGVEARSVEGPLFHQPGLPSTERQEGVTIALRQNAALRAKVEQLAAKAENLRVPPPGITLTGPYRRAVEIQTATRGAVMHITDTLGTYDVLLRFLRLHNTLQSQLAGDLAFAASLARESGKLADRHGELEVGAGRIAGYARQLQATDIPPDFAPFKQEVVATFIRGSELFDRLSYAAYLGADSDLGQINNAINSLAVKNNQADIERFVMLSEVSVTLRRMSELRDIGTQLAGE